jgi:hypothetical protein
MYVAIDPGKRCGVATFNNDGSDRSKGVLQEKDLRAYLGIHIKQSQLPFTNTYEPVEAFIIEGFWLRKDKALEQSGSDMPASRAYGAVELAAQIMDVPLHTQPSSILSQACKWAQVPYNPKKHTPDQNSAYAHGVYWLINNKLRRHPVLDL